MSMVPTSTIAASSRSPGIDPPGRSTATLGDGVPATFAASGSIAASAPDAQNAMSIVILARLRISLDLDRRWVAIFLSYVTPFVVQ
jgi:hypothetical protein